MSTAITAIPQTAELAACEDLCADRHPAVVYIARLGERSQRVMRLALETIAEIASNGRHDLYALPWGALRYQHTAAIRALLMERFAPATANRHLAALRGVLKEAWKLGIMTAEDYHRAVELAPAKGETIPAGREVTAGELRALFAVCADDPSPAGARDAALLTVLYGAGLRRSEAIGLDVADYNTETGELQIRHGKGNKARLVYATNGGKAALDLWLCVHGECAGALLVPVNKGGRVLHRRLTDNAVTNALQKRARQAGVSRFSPHDLRRSYISHLLDAGADISTVQNLAGHSHVTTTQRYDRRGEHVKRKAAELIYVPFAEPKGGEIRQRTP